MSNQEQALLDKAQPIIKRHVLFSSGAGLIPVPIVDVVAVTAIQLDMIKQLCKLFGQSYQESSGKAFVGALTGTTLTRIAAANVGSFLKVIPIIGSTLGGITVSAFSGATTYAIGQVLSQHFATGGSISEFDEEELKSFFEDQFKKGKEMVKEWKEEAEEAIQNTTETISQPDQTTNSERLAQLEELKKSGFVTKTEYERIKKRLEKGK